MYPNKAVQEIIEALRAKIVAALGDNLEGLYLKGSLALGDFNPQTSDVDLLVIVKEPISNEDFAELAKMHGGIQTLPNRYANDVELAYIPLNAIQNFRPRQAYPALERGSSEGLKPKALGANWILEFWTVRERGITLYGPDPKTLIPPIPAGEMVTATRQVLSEDWPQWVDTWDNPGWQTHAGEMRFVVETLCRALYTVSQAELPSKPVAVHWALQTLPEPWRSLVEQSQTWSAGARADSKTVLGVRDFVRWTVSQT